MSSERKAKGSKGKTPDKLEQRARDAAARIFRGSLLVTDPQSAQNDIRIIILAALREAVDAETADLVKHLEWAMDRVPLGKVKATDENGGALWHACPGCKILWSSTMAHSLDCPYAAALAAIHRARGQE